MINPIYALVVCIVAYVIGSFLAYRWGHEVGVKCTLRELDKAIQEICHKHVREMLKEAADSIRDENKELKQ